MTDIKEQNQDGEKNEKIRQRPGWAKFTCHQSVRLSETEKERCEKLYNRMKKTNMHRTKSAFIRYILTIGLENAEQIQIPN